MNFNLANLFRAIVTLLFAAHVFFMYAHVRVSGEHFGFNSITALLGLLFSLVMLVPFVWVYWIADVPQIISKHMLPQRRWSKGQCPTCGYSREGLTVNTCPECGTKLIKPQDYRFGLATIRRFLLVVTIAWLGGCFTAEGLALFDEYLFRQEVESLTRSGNHVRYGRDRTWPMQNGGLVYSDYDGFDAHE